MSETYTDTSLNDWFVHAFNAMKSSEIVLQITQFDCINTAYVSPV